MFRWCLVWRREHLAPPTLYLTSAARLGLVVVVVLVVINVIAVVVIVVVVVVVV